MDTGKIKGIITIFEQSALTSMELEADDLKITLQKDAPVLCRENTASSVQESTKEEAVSAAPNTVSGEAVRSPLVGTFYAAASETSKPFVEVGTTVKEGDILRIIEAMKVMNEIHAPKSGTIKEILVHDGDMVQFDEELMVIGD